MLIGSEIQFRRVWQIVSLHSATVNFLWTTEGSKLVRNVESKWQQKVAMRCQDVCERSQNSSNILQDDSKMSPKIFQTHTTGLKWSQVDSKSLPNGPQTPQDGPNSRQDGPKMSPRGAHVGSQIGEKVKLEVFKKTFVFPSIFNEKCLQAGQEMTGNAPEAFLDCPEWDLMVLCRFPQILGTLQRGVIDSKFSATLRARPTYLMISD